MISGGRGRCLMEGKSGGRGGCQEEEEDVRRKERVSRKKGEDARHTEGVFEVKSTIN